MTNPIDAIGNAIRARHGLPPTSGLTLDDGFGEDVAIAINALTQDAVIIHAARALAADTASRPNSPLHAANMTVAEYEHLARVVLRSVGAS